MGAKLVALYEEVNKVGGTRARVKMALLTKLSSQKALEAPDSPENIQLFEAAVATIKAAVAAGG